MRADVTVSIGTAANAGVAIGRRRLLIAVFASSASAGALALLGGCATPMPASRANSSAAAEASAWSGRLSLRVDGDAAQGFSALFELRGNADVGELVLTSPIGSTLAQLSWSPGQALLKNGNETRSYQSVSALAQAATGAAIPLAALFAWLAGRDQQVPGWQADLSGVANGRLRARRDSPAPTAELRVVFEQL